jgi:hypothetical protein
VTPLVATLVFGVALGSFSPGGNHGSGKQKNYFHVGFLFLSLGHSDHGNT